MGIRLIGRDWRPTDATHDGFKVISVDVELAYWEDKEEELFTYMSACTFGGFPLPGFRIYEADLNEIIRTLEECPSKIYSDLLKVPGDLIIFKKVRDWFKNNYPYSWIEFDVGD